MLNNDEGNGRMNAHRLSRDGRNTAGDSPESLSRNFWWFCIFYSVIHGAVDAVLAFSSAELGTNLGSLGGTVLYAFYTSSALLLAKPCLQLCEAKSTVFFGLIGLLVYVTGFFFAILFPEASSIFFLSGCAVGGIGAGLLWTGQGSYYTLNASFHAMATKSSRSETITHFAGIFAGTYLSFETLYKFIGTFVFIVVGMSSSGAWQPALFGIYTTTAFVSTLFFWTNVKAFKDDPALHLVSLQHVDVSAEDSNDESDSQRRRLLSGDKLDVVDFTTLPTKTQLSASPKKKSSHSYLEVPVNVDVSPVSTTWAGFFDNVTTDMLEVGKMMMSVRKLQFLIPYQICFGLSAGLVDTYVNGVIVKTYIGEGYIGVLSGLVTLTAALLSAPLVLIGNTKKGRGKDWIMIAGGICFGFGGLMLLVLTDAQIALWPVIITYYILHGAARGIWENTNKAVVSEMFEHSPNMRDAAFAAVYFSSGLAGALGFAFFQFLSKSMIALVNLLISGTAIMAFIIARKLHRRDLLAHEVRQVVSTLGDEEEDSVHQRPMSPDDEVTVNLASHKFSNRIGNPLHKSIGASSSISTTEGDQSSGSQNVAYSQI